MGYSWGQGPSEIPVLIPLYFCYPPYESVVRSMPWYIQQSYLWNIFAKFDFQILPLLLILTGKTMRYQVPTTASYSSVSNDDDKVTKINAFASAESEIWTILCHFEFTVTMKSLQRSPWKIRNVSHQSRPPFHSLCIIQARLASTTYANPPTALKKCFQIHQMTSQLRCQSIHNAGHHVNIIVTAWRSFCRV